MSFGELASAETSAFHLFEESGHRTIAIHLDWTRGSSQILRCFWFTLSDHAGCEPLLVIANCRLPIADLKEVLIIVS
jgi:hypothetical protein